MTSHYALFDAPAKKRKEDRGNPTTATVSLNGCQDVYHKGMGGHWGWGDSFMMHFCVFLAFEATTITTV